MVLDYRRLNSLYIYSSVNGLLGYDAQFLTVNNINAATNKKPLKPGPRTNNETIKNFQLLLKGEIWESVYMFNYCTVL